MRHSGWYCIIVAILLHLGAASAAVLGLDYGYQFGKAIVVSPQAPLEIVLTPESKRKDENGVGIKKFNGRLERTYGSAVSSSMTTRFPGNSLMHLKPLLGKMAEEGLSQYLKMHPGIKTKESGRGGISFVVEGQEFPVEEVVGMNIQQYVNRANELLKEKGGVDSVEHIALTIPEYYTVEQRNAFLDAVALIPLQQCFLVNEGLSVAIDYALKQSAYENGDKKYHLVYDMGAGSTVATLVSIQYPQNVSEPLSMEFIGYGYTEEMSGSKLTQAIADILIAKFAEENPSIKTKQIESNARAMAKIIQTAEKAKQILSVNTNAPVSIESIIDDMNFKTVLHRQEFEDYLDDMLSVIVAPISDAFKNQLGANIVTMKEIDSVIITGGSTRVPIVQKKLSDYLGEKTISKSVNADESAVNGATMRGVQLSKAFKMKPLAIIDRIIYPYSVKSGKNDDWLEIFPVGSQYPNSTSILINPEDDKFLPFKLELYENHRLFQIVEVIPDQVKSKFTTDKCPGGVVYNVTFALSVNRLFDCTKVEAVCLPATTNDEAEITANSTSTKSLYTGKINTMRLSTTSQFANLHPYTTRQRMEAKSKLDEWNRKDTERQKLEQELNQLETILYDSRNYLETDAVLEKGPQSEVTKLSQLVGEYLEWLDYESEDANIFEVTGKIIDISTLKGKIELYVEAADEKLDSEKFTSLLDEGKKLLGEVNGYNGIIDEQLQSLKVEFEALGLNVTEEYGKLRVPKNLDVSTSKKGNLVSGLQSLLVQVEAMVKDNSMNDKAREELFELKVMCENSIEDLRTLHRITESAHKYRSKDLQSLYNRKLKAVLRQEKKKAEEEMEASRVHNDTVLDAREPLGDPEDTNKIEHDEL